MQRVQILIEVVDRAQVPEMPIKSRLVFARAGRDRRHDHIAAVAGVPRNGEVPGRVRGRSTRAGSSSRAVRCAGHHERGGGPGDSQGSARPHAGLPRAAGPGAVGFGDGVIGIGAILHSIGSAILKGIHGILVGIRGARKSG
jgi:hypothetical protein